MPHPEFNRLRHALKRYTSRNVRWSGVVYRSASPRYANRDDLLTGVGSKTAGGRWNPPKSFPTVYSSLDPHTALDEVLAHFRYYGFPMESAMSRITLSVRVQLVRVLNFTDGKTRSALRVSERRMLVSRGGKSRSLVATRSHRPWDASGMSWAGEHFLSPRPRGGEGRGEPHHLSRESLAAEFA
jgi:RES domain-containing protein